LVLKQLKLSTTSGLFVNLIRKVKQTRICVRIYRGKIVGGNANSSHGRTRINSYNSFVLVHVRAPEDCWILEQVKFFSTKNKMQTTHFICLTIVLLPDSPAPAI